MELSNPDDARQAKSSAAEAPAGPPARERSKERRATRRYPLSTALKYKALLYKREITGLGLTVNISSSGLLVHIPGPLPEGLAIELSIAWPVRLDDNVALALHVVGRTVRTQGDYAGIVIQRHEFRTRGTRSIDGVQL